MSRASHNGGQTTASPAELRAEVEHAREQLADTVSQLAAKADIRSRAQRKAQDTRARMQHHGRHAADQGGGRQGAMAAVGGGVLLLAVVAALLHKRRRT